MKSFLSNFLIFALILLVLIIIFGLVFALISVIALGLGRLLGWFIPTFSNFEATLLATIFALITYYTLRALSRLFLPSELMQNNSGSRWEAEEEQSPDEYQTIPLNRFYASSKERTWEAWLQAELANDVYAEFQDAPNTVAHLNHAQLQELAIRLAEAGVNIIKRKTGRARHLSTNLTDLRRELNNMGQRAYDEDILRMALSAINMNLNFFEEPLREVIRAQEWDQPATIPEHDPSA